MGIEEAPELKSINAKSLAADGFDSIYKKLVDAGELLKEGEHATTRKVPQSWLIILEYIKARANKNVCVTEERQRTIVDNIKSLADRGAETDITALQELVRLIDSYRVECGERAFAENVITFNRLPMSYKTVPAHGQRVEEILTKYEKTPNGIVPQWAEKMDMSFEGINIPREIFFDFVSKIASGLRTKLKNTVCINDNGAHVLRTNIYCLAELMGRDKAMGVDVQTGDRSLATIAETAEKDGIGCEDCLTSQKECQKRSPHAPFANAIQKAKEFIRK